MQYSLDNVISNPVPGSLGDPGLQLFVRGYTGSGAVRTAELATKRVDMHYGSYRAAIKSTAVSGTCGAMFWVGSTSVLSFELQCDSFHFDPSGTQPLRVRS